MFSRLIILLGLLTGALWAQVTPNRVFSGPYANRPTSCKLNDLYFATDQPSTNNTFYCASQNNWILVSAAEVPINLTVNNLIATGMITGHLVGNADTATAFDNVPMVCSGAQKPNGVDVNGNATGCSTPSAAAGGSNGQIQINSSGSLGGIAAPTGTVVGTTDTQTITHKTFDATNVFPALPYDASGAAAAAQSAAQAFASNGSNITSGTVAAARVAVLNQNTTGNAATATALAAFPSNCSPSNFPTGINAAGAAQNCTPAPCANIMSFGGNNGGSASNNTAWNAALASFGSAPACVEFSGGTFAFTTSPSWTAANVSTAITVKCQGPDNTRLLFTSGSNGLVLNTISTANAVNVSGCSFVTQGVGGSTGLLVNNTGTTMTENVVSNITNNAFYGSDCKACTNYWSNAILLESAIAFNIGFNKFIGTSGTPNGTGINILKTTAAVPVVFNIVGNVFDYDGLGIVIGDFVQGVTIAVNNFTGVGKGVYVASGYTYGDNDQLFIGPSNQFNATSLGIDIESPFRHTNVFDNYFVVPGTNTGGFFTNYAMTTVSGNQLINIGGGGGSGFVFGTYADDASLVYGNQTQFFANGINLEAASAHTSVFMNVGTSNTNDVVNTGTGNAVGLGAFTGSTTSSFQVVDGIVIHQ